MPTLFELGAATAIAGGICYLGYKGAKMILGKNEANKTVQTQQQVQNQQNARVKLEMAGLTIRPQPSMDSFLKGSLKTPGLMRVG